MVYYNQRKGGTSQCTINFQTSKQSFIKDTNPKHDGATFDINLDEILRIIIFKIGFVSAEAVAEKVKKHKHLLRLSNRSINCKKKGNANIGGSISSQKVILRKRG